MKLHEILSEDAGAGSTGGAAISGVPGSLFGGGMVDRLPKKRGNKYKIRVMKFKNNVRKYS